MKLKKYEGNPILSPNPENYWERFQQALTEGKVRRV